jgi:hypothetical protein
MKLSQETIAILKNYSTINPSVLFKPGSTLSTMSMQKSIFAKATIKEEVERTFGIYELNKFLGVLSMFREPELRFFDKFLEVFSGKQRVRYTYADPTLIVTPPEKELVFPDPEVQFDLTSEDLGSVMKALAVMSLPEICITGDGTNLEVQAVNSKNPSADVYSIAVGSTDKTFQSYIKTENLKFLAKDYHLSVSSKGIVKFEAQDITYFVASEAHSYFK